MLLICHLPRDPRAGMVAPDLPLNRAAALSGEVESEKA